MNFLVDMILTLKIESDIRIKSSYLAVPRS